MEGQRVVSMSTTVLEHINKASRRSPKPARASHLVVLFRVLVSALRQIDLSEDKASTSRLKFCFFGSTERKLSERTRVVHSYEILECLGGGLAHQHRGVGWEEEHSTLACLDLSAGLALDHMSQRASR